MENKVLLIADDDEMNRKIIRKFLSGSYIVLEAEDGRKALEIMGSTKIDLLLLDILMPNVDGLEVLQRMKDNGMLKTTGVLVATSIKEKTERTALSLGADDIVSKPYDPIVIQKRLENIYASKEILKQKNLMENEDVEKVFEVQGIKLAEKANKVISTIHTYTEIIKSNMDNESLVLEATKKIDKETNKLTDMFNVDGWWRL